MDEGVDYINLHWEEEVKSIPREIKTEQIIPDLDNAQSTTYSNINELKQEQTHDIIQSTDQIAAEHLMFLAQDVNYTDSAPLTDDLNVECVTEEVITDDWVISGGQERVEVPLEHLTYPVLDIKEDNDLDVPLPTDQDQYTAMRPWPCDFCSRRFRKKAALMNHMVAHQNDRPHACNLCGVRYVRKCDLMNHLKVHAFVPDNSDGLDYDDVLDNNRIVKPKKKRGRRKKVPEPVEDMEVWENMTSARTQQWSRRARSPPAARASPPSPPSEPEPPPAPAPPPADPSRPFVCRHCGVGFAREKALQSHARVHGGDSPMECASCGELVWSREALAAHTRTKHPHLPLAHDDAAPAFENSDSGDDMEFRLSPESHAGGERPVYDSMRGPELFCQDCGVAFQRADLLRRHVAAAHSYQQRTESGSSAWPEHTCEVCADTFTDALQLLAHAETHADRHAPSAGHRFKKMSRGRNNTSASSGSRQFPCRVCGKVFGSRSSQQIHVRIHTGERPYACRFCWKAFADGGTLRKHERIHTGEKPYACAVCPRAFNQRVVLREHVRSHHSAPDRRANGGPAFNCVVCSRTLHTSAELVQHLIQHCDENTALKRQPQSGPRKYKRRRKTKIERSPDTSREWEQRSPSPAASRSASPASPGSPAASPGASVASPGASVASPGVSVASGASRRAARHSPASPGPLLRRRRRRADPPPRPRMIHTEEPRPRIKQVRARRVPRRVADDVRAIGRAPPSPDEEHREREGEGEGEREEAGAPFRCEMCSAEFPRRDALLLHVPAHI